MTISLETAFTSLSSEQWKVDQVVVFDWLDGPRSGLCALAQPQCCFAFEILGERSTEDDLDDRLFCLKEAPIATVDQALSILSELGPPTSPIWVPRWAFNSPALRIEAEQKLDALLTGLIETPLIIRTKDMLHFQGYWISERRSPDKVA
jgi:hypothetical protein